LTRSRSAVTEAREVEPECDIASGRPASAELDIHPIRTDVTGGTGIQQDDTVSLSSIGSISRLGHDSEQQSFAVEEHGTLDELHAAVMLHRHAWLMRYIDRRVGYAHRRGLGRQRRGPGG